MAYPPGFNPYFAAPIINLFQSEMKKLYFLFLLPLFAVGSLQAQLNMNLQDSLTYHVGVNDVCGWSDPEGNEYAIVGLNTGVSIVDINNDVIQEVAFVPGEDNLWRDINTFGHYAYVCSEARIGLYIIDLQYLPDSVHTYIWRDSIPTPNGMREFQKAHTLWIDEFGICYLNGSNLNSGGVVMIDVATNPTDPDFLGMAPAIYSHDVYARDSMIYSAEIYAGNLTIYDAHDPSNVVTVSSTKTPTEFTHNAWLSDDSQVLYTTDERANSYVAAYDITDPSNPFEIDRYRHAPTNGEGDVPHNVFVWNDWLVVAYYTNGTTIVDAARPDNLIEVGSFDSFLGEHGGFNGVWGSWPYLPSGKILSSDRNSGLYVFEPNYIRACYLEGIVVDKITTNPIFNALVTIETEEILFPEYTKTDGSFKTGKAISGTFNVHVSKEGYYPEVVTLDFINGELLTPTIELTPLPVYTVSGEVIDHTNGVVAFAPVSFSGDYDYEISADENGVFEIPVFGGTYSIQAGVWGNLTEQTITIDGSQNIVLQTTPGYWDDFDIDLGWTIESNAQTGSWERGRPTRQTIASVIECGSDGDSPNDVGELAYTTGIATSVDATLDDVSSGSTNLTSPSMNLSTLFKPSMSFDFWLCEFPGNTYDGIILNLVVSDVVHSIDTLRNGIVEGSWQTYTYSLEEYWEEEDVKLSIVASDTTTSPNTYVLKAHFDNFRITEQTTSVDVVNDPAKGLLVFPNPVFEGNLFIQNPDDVDAREVSVQIVNVAGQIIYNNKLVVSSSPTVVDLIAAQGMYILTWSDKAGNHGNTRFAVLGK